MPKTKFDVWVLFVPWMIRPEPISAFPWIVTVLPVNAPLESRKAKASAGPDKAVVVDTSTMSKAPDALMLLAEKGASTNS